MRGFEEDKDDEVEEEAAAEVLARFRFERDAPATIARAAHMKGTAALFAASVKAEEALPCVSSAPTRCINVKTRNSPNIYCLPGALLRSNVKGTSACTTGSVQKAQ